uniref:Death domain-containing protein n=1 Tax=Amphimedon queenslandica TaxID=400682 RepID=A0A1X7TQM3_AMPQE
MSEMGAEFAQQGLLYKMIDVSQWRASIGLWNYCQAASSRPANGHHSHSFKAAVDSKSGSTGYIQEEKRCTLPAVLFIIGFIVIYFCVLLLKHNSIPPPGHCYCYQLQCTTGDTVTDTLQSVVLHGDINIFSLMSRLLLLLSGDVELNPGPTVEEESVKDSESQSYSKMMQHFNATLSLSKDVSELKRHCQMFLNCISQGGPTDDAARLLAIEWEGVYNIQSSVAPSASTIKLTDATPHVITAPFGSGAREEKLHKSLDELNLRFSKLVKVFKMTLREKIKHNSHLVTDVSEWLIEYMEWEHDSVDSNIDDILKKIQPYYDFLDCKLLLDMSEKFLQDVTFIDGEVTYKLVDELQSHTFMSVKLCTSNTVFEFKKWLLEHFKSFERNVDNLPHIDKHLQTPWDDISIEGLYKLIKKLLPRKHLHSKETQENLERALKESGSIKYKVSVAIIQGEARVGKTSIKSLILKLPYSEVSTSCIEAPCMAFGSFSINRYGKMDDNKWKLVSDNKMDDIVIAELKKIASGLKIPNEIIQSPTAANASDIINPIPTTPEAALASNAVQDLNTEDSAMPIVKLPVEKVGVEVLFEDGLQNFDVLKYLKKKHRTSQAGFDRDWLYFFDSGGQIQFQKLLLAFMPCSSVLVLVVNLSKNLSDQSSTSMKLPDGTINVDEYSLKVDDMLRQVVSAVNSNTKQFRSIMEGQQHIKTPKNEKLQVITIGTHRDIYNKQGTAIEEIQAKRMKLKSILQSESIQIAYTDDDDLIHVVDGSKAKRSEFDDDPAIETISKALNEQAYEIEVPLKWHYFGVILRNEAKENNGILELSSCIGFGKLLDMPEKEVTSALNFFHALKLLFYYHDSPAKDIVFVKLDAVINIIRKLMIKVCKPLDKLEAGPDEVAQLATKGYLSIEVLEKNAGALKGRESMLLGLFEYLKIAALIPTNKKGVVFLMPALLPVKDVSDSSTFSKTLPLLFYFKEPVPMGLFCAVIVQLLSYSGDEKWDIITEELNFSNFFTIQKKIDEDMYQVILVEQLYCIEVYCEERSCRQSKNQKLPDSQCDEYWSWFITEQKVKDMKRKRKKSNPSRSNTLKEKELNMKTVMRIFHSSANYYKLIGIGLDVNVTDLKPIPGTANDNLIEVFQRWFEADRDVNWDALRKLCDDFPDELGKAKSKLLEYIGQSMPDNVHHHSPVDDVPETEGIHNKNAAL